MNGCEYDNRNGAGASNRFLIVGTYSGAQEKNARGANGNAMMKPFDDVPLSRRTVLRGGLAAVTAGTLLRPESVLAAAKPASFSFVHLTDTHIQPELGAKRGVHKALEAVRKLPEKPAFILMGGDIVMDAALVPRSRAEMVYDLWQEEVARLNIPVHYSIGNHDLFGVGASVRAESQNSPDYGKEMWKRRLKQDATYHTFDHNGWRFIVLDSVGITPDGPWEGVLDDAQLAWVDNLLRKTGKQMPMVVLTHFPIMTLFAQYTEAATAPLTPGLVVKNGKTFRDMIQGYNVKAVFQGHTHVVEDCAYLGTQYITGGAVSGDWWKGKRLGVHPEGFAVATVKGNDLTWRYVPYGWDAAKEQPANAPTEPKA